MIVSKLPKCFYGGVMPRNKKDWDGWFSRRENKKSYAKGTKKVEKLPSGVSELRGCVIGESNPTNYEFQSSHIEKFANYRRKNPTPAEAKLEIILNELNGGVLKGDFVREHIISGKWIVDFFFPKVRLAIEVDGSIHLTGIQKKKDIMKDADAARFDITLLRLTNCQVFGNRSYLVNKLRAGWRAALNRENMIIGRSIK